MTKFLSLTKVQGAALLAAAALVAGVLAGGSSAAGSSQFTIQLPRPGAAHGRDR